MEARHLVDADILHRKTQLKVIAQPVIEHSQDQTRSSQPGTTREVPMLQAGKYVKA
jgi:hypothetical protein